MEDLQGGELTVVVFPADVKIVKALKTFDESTTCRICGRALTHPESVKRGIGPTCWKRLNQALKDHGLKEEPEDKPGISIQSKDDCRVVENRCWNRDGTEIMPVKEAEEP